MEKESKYIDYTPTDKQLENICTGMIELEDDDNCFLFIRMNEVLKDEMKLAAMLSGSKSFIIKAILKLMEDKEEFAEIISVAAEMHKNATYRKVLGSLMDSMSKLLDGDKEEK